MTGTGAPHRETLVLSMAIRPIEFNSRVLDIDKQLTSDDLNYLKFLCEWEMPETAGKIENVRSGQDLFKLLTDKGKLSPENHCYLGSLLKSIGREVLVERCIVATIGETEAESAEAKATGAAPDSVRYIFAQYLVKVAQSLLSRDLNQLKFLLCQKLQVPHHRITSPTELFLELRRQTLLDEYRTKTLQDALCDIKRLDLVHEINKYLEITHQQVYDAMLQEKIMERIRELEKEFLKLTNSIEDKLRNDNVSIEVMTRQFRSLPPSLKRQQQGDDKFSDIRQRVLKSTTIKELFDNLTELKYWSFMNPDILTHVVQDFKSLHFDIAIYQSKLLAFKQSTKVKDVVGLEFLLPDYYVEVTIKVREGWREKTLCEAEKSVETLLIRLGYQYTKVGGWQSVNHGCVELVVIFLTHTINVSTLGGKELFDTCNASGIISITIDQTTVYTEDQVVSVKVYAV